MITHHRWEESVEEIFDLYNHLNTSKVCYDTIIDTYRNLNNELFLGWKVDNEPENKYHIPDFKNGNEYVVIVDDLFKLIKQSCIDKKTLYQTVYKLRKKY